jgi:hypothetical protein
LTTRPSPAPNFRTGLPGKPSVFNVIAAEVRRRYADNERHLNRMGIESPLEWAESVLPWFRAAYPEWPQPTAKTLQNRLTTVLTELRLLARP